MIEYRYSLQTRVASYGKERRVIKDQLLTVDRASRVLKIHVDTVRQQFRQKDLPAARVGRSYLVNEDDPKSPLHNA